MQSRLGNWISKSLGSLRASKSHVSAKSKQNARPLSFKPSSKLQRQPKFSTSSNFVKRHFATWTEPSVSKSDLIDHFPNVATSDLLKQIEIRFPQYSTLSPGDSAQLQRYSDTLAARSEAGDEEAKLSIILATTFGDSDEKLISEATSWLESTCARGENVKALYYYGLYMATGSFDELAVHTGGIKPEPVYYIDVDNLHEFLGLDRGVSPEGSSEPFDFQKWLRKERLKRLAANSKVEEISTSSSAVRSSCGSQRAGNLQRAVTYLRLGADKGDEKCLVTLMLLKFDQESPIYSHEDGLALLQEISNLGSGLGLLRAAEVLGDLSLYEKAAETKFPEALFRLALIRFEEESEASQQQAVALVQQAAEQGHRQAKYWCAQWEEAKNEAADGKLVLQLYRDAASPPHPDEHACFQLGNIYYEGLYGQAVNFPLAFKFWKIGAKLGHEDCLVNLAAMYYSGIGTKQDFEKAFYCNQNAAVLGSKNAMANLVDMYEHGIGVPKSLEQAEYYKKLAAGDSDDDQGLTVLKILQESSTDSENSKPALSADSSRTPPSASSL
jgi:TPR repeat protein